MTTPSDCEASVGVSTDLEQFFRKERPPSAWPPAVCDGSSADFCRLPGGVLTSDVKYGIAQRRAGHDNLFGGWVVSRLSCVIFSTAKRSDNRAEINKTNSQNSTGPKTSAGKQRSSLNALRHGLTSQIVVMPTEDLLIYQRHLKSFTDEYHPEGATEAHLVQALSDTAWRLNRVAALEANLLTLAASNQPNPFANAPAEVQDAMAIVAALESQSKALANLSLHSQRLSRQFESTVAQLRELQKTRYTREKRDVDHLLDIMEMYKSKGKTYLPSDDGFIFSQNQINAAIRTRNRERLISEAFHHAAA